MSETTFRRYLSKGMKKFGHFSQIESHETSVGFPDVDFCIEGVEGCIELKYWSSKKGYVLRRSQVAWMRDRIKAGGRVFLAFLREQDGKHYYIVRIDIFNLSVFSKISKASEWEAQACGQWDGRMNFDELKEILINERN